MATETKPDNDPASACIFYLTEPDARKNPPREADSKERLYRLTDPQGQGGFCWALSPGQVKANYCDLHGITAELIDGRRGQGLISNLRKLVAADPGALSATQLHAQLLKMLSDEEAAREKSKRKKNDSSPAIEDEPEDGEEVEPEPPPPPPTPVRKPKAPPAAPPPPAAAKKPAPTAPKRRAAPPPPPPEPEEEFEQEEEEPEEAEAVGEETDEEDLEWEEDDGSEDDEDAGGDAEGSLDDIEEWEGPVSERDYGPG